MPAAVTSGKLLSRRNWGHVNFNDVSYNSRRKFYFPFLIQNKTGHIRVPGRIRQQIICL